VRRPSVWENKGFSETSHFTHSIIRTLNTSHAKTATEKFSIDFLIKLIRNSHEKEPGGSQADPEGCSIDVIIKFKRKLTEKEPGRHKGIFD